MSSQKRGAKSHFNYIVNRNACVLFVKKTNSALYSLEYINSVAHWEAFCRRINLVFVFCWILYALVLRTVFGKHSCLKWGEKGTKHAVMSVKWSFGERCITPACELPVVWFSIGANNGWKMTSSPWLCTSFISQLLLPELLRGHRPAGAVLWIARSSWRAAAGDWLQVNLCQLLWKQTQPLS